MTIEGDVVQALKSYAPLASIVGGRVVPDRLQSMPSVVYQRISNVFGHTLGRNIANEQTRIQFAAYSTDRDQAEDIAGALVDGVMAMNLNGTRSVKATTIDNEISDYDPTATAYRRIVDVILVSTEAGA